MSRPAATTRVRIGPRSAGMTMTPVEFDALPESRWAEGHRYELINGVLVVTPPAGEGERGPNDVLGYLLRRYRDTHPLGSALDVTLPEQTIPTTPNRRRADRAIWAGLGRIPNVETEVPAIVVEFVSGRRRDAIRDYELKHAEYLAAGVREYWIIDRFRRIMTVHRRAAGGAETLGLAEADTCRTDLLPGFALPLARLLAEADHWPGKRRRRPPAGGER